MALYLLVEHNPWKYTVSKMGEMWRIVRAYAHPENGVVKFTNPYLLHMDISLSIFSFNVSFYVRYLKIWSYIYFWNINLRNRSRPKWHIWSEKNLWFWSKSSSITKKIFTRYLIDHFMQKYGIHSRSGVIYEW